MKPILQFSLMLDKLVDFFTCASHGQSITGDGSGVQQTGRVSVHFCGVTTGKLGDPAHGRAASHHDANSTPECTGKDTRGSCAAAASPCLCHYEEGSVLPHGQNRPGTLAPHAYLPLYDWRPGQAGHA